MACPHGNGDAVACSLCLGVPARRVTIADGNMLIDGELIVSMLAHTKNAADIMSQRPAARRGWKAPRHCSKCQGTGHNAKTCGRY